MVTILVIGVITIAVASYFDATSSIGLREKTWIYQDKEKRFSVKRYVIFNAIAVPLTVILGVLVSELTAAIALFAGAALRFWAGLYHNPKVRSRSDRMR